MKAIAVDPTDPNRLFVAMNDYCDGCDNGAIEVSTDGGRTWTDVSPSSGSVEDVAIDPFDPNTVFVASVFSPTGMYRTSDGGLSWQDAGFSVSYVTALAMDRSTPGVGYAGTAGVGVYKTIDGGSTWLGTGLPAVFVTDLAVSPSNPSVLFAAATGTDGAWRSGNGGLTWTAVGGPLPDGFTVRAVAVDPLDEDHVFAAPFGAGVYETNDGGATWSPRNEGLGDLWVWALAVDAGGSILYAGTGSLGALGAGDGVFQIRLG